MVIQVVFGHKTILTVIFEPPIQCDVGLLDFWSHDPKYHHVSFMLVIFRLGQPEITKCVLTIRKQNVLISG